MGDYCDILEAFPGLSGELRDELRSAARAFSYLDRELKVRIGEALKADIIRLLELVRVSRG